QNALAIEIVAERGRGGRRAAELLEHFLAKDRRAQCRSVGGARELTGDHQRQLLLGLEGPAEDVELALLDGGEVGGAGGEVDEGDVLLAAAEGAGEKLEGRGDDLSDQAE